VAGGAMQGGVFLQYEVGPRRVREVGKARLGEKNNSFLRFFGPFIVLLPYPLLKTYDGCIRREGYGGPELGDNYFQLFSLLIV
jgi:hypothetical protein